MTRLLVHYPLSLSTKGPFNDKVVLTMHSKPIIYPEFDVKQTKKMDQNNRKQSQIFHHTHFEAISFCVSFISITINIAPISCSNVVSSRKPKIANANFPIRRDTQHLMAKDQCLFPLLDSSIDVASIDPITAITKCPLLATRVFGCENQR
jgi:hypothetical protein